MQILSGLYIDVERKIAKLFISPQEDYNVYFSVISRLAKIGLHFKLTSEQNTQFQSKICAKLKLTDSLTPASLNAHLVKHHLLHKDQINPDLLHELEVKYSQRCALSQNLNPIQKRVLHDLIKDALDELFEIFTNEHDILKCVMHIRNEDFDVEDISIFPEVKPQRVARFQWALTMLHKTYYFKTSTLNKAFTETGEALDPVAVRQSFFDLFLKQINKKITINLDEKKIFDAGILSAQRYRFICNDDDVFCKFDPGVAIRSGFECVKIQSDFFERQELFLRSAFSAAITERIKELRASQKQSAFFCIRQRKRNKIDLLQLLDGLIFKDVSRSLSQLITDFRFEHSETDLEKGWFMRNTQNMLNDFTKRSRSLQGLMSAFYPSLELEMGQRQSQLQYNNAF